MAADKMKEILKHFPDLENGWKEMEEKLKAEPEERELLSLKYREMSQRESSKESLVESEFNKVKMADSDLKVMKANEALEILSSDDIYNHIDIGRYSWEEIQEAVDILVRQQHTRTDAFIEKACKYLMEYEFNDSPTIADRRKRVDKFRKYMEENKL